MVEVRPDEISAILRQQLGNVSTSTIRRSSTVLQVGMVLPVFMDCRK